MSDVDVLDASAVLALLQAERGQQVVRSAILGGHALISAVNYSEVLAKLCERGLVAADAQSALDSLDIPLVEFDEAMAVRTALLKVPTKSIGASLGDRACLALAELRADAGDTPVVYTGERQWNKLKWPFKIVVIR